MFNKKKQPPIKSLVAHGCQITGNFNFAEGLRLDGELIGNVLGLEDKPSILVISETAHVTGEIQADQPKAHITGDVTYKLLEMHQGAIIAGKLCPMVAQSEEKPVLKLAANNQ